MSGVDDGRSLESEDDATGLTAGAATEASGAHEAASQAVRRFQIVVVEGPRCGVVWESESDRCSIGSHLSNDLVLDDPTVSRFHCEVKIDVKGARVRDLDSRNGTVVDGVGVVEGFLRGGSLLRLGCSIVRFEFGMEKNRLPISARHEFGSLVGPSAAMRTAFALLERAAASDATVLIEGETGTGKEGAAESIHGASKRRDKPFVVIDCSAIPENLIESELFGHEKGAFTGAAGQRIGAFEEAHTGTIFLDEIGELPAELQPKLLRVLEQREIRRVGSNTYRSIDVRVIAATNRDLRAEVNAGRFRSDVYFRLAVVRISLPSLRNRPEDIPILASRILSSLQVAPNVCETFNTPEFVASLQRATWPGNVRELRNYLERCLVFENAIPIAEADSPQVQVHIAGGDPTLSYEEARRRAVADFERNYVANLIRYHKGKAAQAARAAGMNRTYFYRLMQRHGLKGS